MSTSAPAPASMPRVPPLALLVFIAFTGTLAMHIFVPAMPNAAKDLKTDAQTIQMAITIYTLGLAAGQLIYGPLSDVIGRRRAIMGGITLYIIGTIASGVATTPEFLIAARFVQALGGAGGLALTRVVVADTSQGVNSTKGIAILNMILLLGPGLAPVIGATIADFAGWRGVFVALTVMAATTLAVAAFKLPETGTPTYQLKPGKFFSGFGEVMGNSEFRRIATGGAFGSTAFYGYFVSAPFILNGDMGLSVQAVGYIMGATLAAAAAGTLLTRAIVGRVSERSIHLVFSLLGVAAGLVFLITAVAQVMTPVLVIGLSMVVLFVAGAMGPVTVGMTLRLSGPQAASGSSLYGFFQMVSGVVCSFAAGLFVNHQLGCGLVLTAAYVFCAVQLLRPGKPVQPVAATPAAEAAELADGAAP